MKSKKLIIITLVVLLVALVALAGCKPNDSGDKNYGVYAEYGICAEELTQEQLEKLDSLLEKAVEKLQEFVFDNGYTTAKVSVVEQKIRIEILGDDIVEAMFNQYIVPRDVEFKEYVDGSDGDFSLDDPNGKVKLDSKLTGLDIASVEVIFYRESNRYCVSLKFTDEGKAKFTAATTALKGERMSIWIDGKLAETPYVSNIITDGVVEIGYKYSYQDAWKFATKIAFCDFPLKLELKRAGVLEAPTSGDKN